MTKSDWAVLELAVSRGEAIVFIRTSQEIIDLAKKNGRIIGVNKAKEILQKFLGDYTHYEPLEWDLIKGYIKPKTKASKEKKTKPAVNIDME